MLTLALPVIGALAFLVLGCFRLFTVPSSSMAPTFSAGSYIVVSRLETGFSRYTFDLFPLPIQGRWPMAEFKRGDIIVFRRPSDHETFYIKRIVGLPGDTIAMQAGRLVINGVQVPREKLPATPTFAHDRDVMAATYAETLPEGARHTIIETSEDQGILDSTPEVKVPQGEVFVMGDNRDNSADSRTDMGTIPLELINGKVTASFRVPGATN